MASNYEKLVKALRYCGNFTEREGCDESCEYFNDMDCPKRIMFDAAATIEALQAEVERLTDCNEELRERQTYIDRYGTEWLTSAKDVPNYAYEHGYADGMAEVKAQLPKRGKWKCSYPEIEPNPMFMYGICSICGFEQSISNKLNYCPNCGAKMG